MPTKDEAKVLRFLQERSDEGATVEQVRVACEIGRHKAAVILANTFGIYIDRWTAGTTTHQEYQPVYCLADVPQDTPKPEKLNVEVASPDRVFNADAYAAIHVDRRVHRLTVDERGIAL